MLHHMVMQNKPKLIFDNADLQPQFYRNSGFTLADPLSVGLKERKDFIFVGNGFICY